MFRTLYINSRESCFRIEAHNSAIGNLGTGLGRDIGNT
jgi:hypothetical protein